MEVAALLRLALVCWLDLALGHNYLSDKVTASDCCYGNMTSMGTMVRLKSSPLDIPTCHYKLALP